MSNKSAVWFPAIKTNTGPDFSTRRIAQGLEARGIRTEITWLPHRAEYLPWSVPVPTPPKWATLTYINSWLHPRFLPKNIPVVTGLRHSIHDPSIMPYKTLAQKIYHRYWIGNNEKKVLKKSAKVIAVSNFVAESTKANLYNCPIDVVYNGVDTQKFTSGIRQAPINRPFRLLFVGSWIERKGVDLLAAIMKELGNDFKLYYTGGAAAEKDKVNMPANMHDLGRLNGESAVIQAMQQADALLFPSRSEGHPLAVIEAMACRLPIIGFLGSVVEETVANNEAGLLCPVDDIQSLANACRRLVSDKELYLKLSEGARSLVEEKYSYDLMIDSYLEIFTKVFNLV